jgi:hypothetical protein
MGLTTGKRTDVGNIIDITPNMHHEMRQTLGQIVNRFKFDWNILRTVMVTTGAVISGSSALAVLKAGEFVPQDLDIYVTSDNFATVLVFFNEQEYNIQIPAPSSTKKKYPTSTVVLTLKNGTGEKIDLIATTEPHIIHAITQFHSTCVMNYISYYGIVCLYPEWTMRNKGFVRARVVDQQAIDKY